MTCGEGPLTSRRVAALILALGTFAHAHAPRHDAIASFFDLLSYFGLSHEGMGKPWSW
jgi:hypothetical protein